MTENHQEPTQELRKRYQDRESLPGYINLTDLFGQKLHDESWLIPNIIAKGRITQIHGPAKAGKTMLGYDMASAMATGNDFAGMPTTTSKVLYIDYENHPSRDTHVRLKAMGYEAEQLEKNLILLSYPKLPCLDTPEGGAHLAAIAEEHEIDVVIVDTISRTIKGEENSNDTWNRHYTNTILPLKRLGVAFLRIDHTGKDVAKGPRGGSAKLSDVDIICSITSTKSGIKVDFVDGRIPPLFPHLHLVLEKHPRLHYRTAESGENITDEARILDIIQKLDSAGVPPNITNEQTRNEMRTRGITSKKAISEEVTRRRKQRLQKNNPEGFRPSWGWGWATENPSPRQTQPSRGCSDSLHRNYTWQRELAPR